MFDRIRRWIRFNLLYLGCPPWDTGVSPPELNAFLSEKEPGRALDAGCGTGTNLLTMAQNGWEVIGVDIAWLSVLRARRELG
jgi:SAM-dependent methyltransferase